jgi:hypothetical protein
LAKDRKKLLEVSEEEKHYLERLEEDKIIFFQIRKYRHSVKTIPFFFMAIEPNKTDLV